MQDLRSLSIFLKVAELRSFVRAAEALGITQSGASNAVSRLEAQLGVRLLARTTRRVNLTEDGAAFFDRCRQALGELEEAELVLRDVRLRPAGNLRLDMSVSFGRLKVLPLLGAFRAQFPDIRLNVTFTDRYVDLVEEAVDVCIRFGELSDSSLVARRLVDTQFRVVGSPEYFRKHGRPKRPDELATHNCLAFTLRDTKLIRSWRFKQYDSETVISPKGDLSFNDGAALCDAAVAGYGLVQVHDYYLDAALAGGALEPVLEKFKPKPDPIWLIYPQNRHLAPKVRAFIDFVITKFRTWANAKG
jgi:DNA-binding transcriptional LysR family regulator